MASVHTVAQQPITSPPMRILQICHKPPRPSVDGGCLAMNAITSGLLNNGADVKLLSAFTRKHPLTLDTLDAEYVDQVNLEGVPLETDLDFRDAYIALLNGDSYNISRFYSHQFAMVLKRILSRSRYDVVHLESLYTTPYIDTIRMHAPTALVSLRSHNHEFQIWEQRWKATRNPVNRLALRHLTNTLERYEKSVLSKVDTIVSISSTEGMGYRNWGFTGPIHVAGFGIETPKSLHDVGFSSEQPRTKNGVKMFHLGAMDWAPNREGVDWFLGEVWPKVLQAHPRSEFHLAGKGLRPDVWTDVPGVVNHGEVEDAAAFAAQYDLLVVPLLRGAGIRVKIVESFSRGIPVASTTMGVQGLEIMLPDSLVQAEPGDFADALIELLKTPERLNELSEAGRYAARRCFDQDKIGADLLEFYGQHVRI